MPIISPFSSETDAQRADLARLRMSLIPDRVTDALRLSLPEAGEVEVRDVTTIAKWAYYGFTQMPYSETVLKELSGSTAFKDRMDEVIAALEALNPSMRDAADQEELESYCRIRTELETGPGGQKRLEMYAKYLGYASYDEYRGLLRDVNAFCHASGLFSYVTLNKPGSYFDNRVADSPELVALFGNAYQAHRRVLSKLAPFWLDATIECLQRPGPDVWIEAFGDWLMILAPRQGHHLAEAIVGAYEELGPRRISATAPYPKLSDFVEVARGHFGNDVNVELQRVMSQA